ncbi:MAG TPA: glycosyltransferase family 2 protein [Patescibacteria group bacterium]|uniref:Glycosyltransferase 2-like domain-containing protein n=1 Tax=Candidatus Woesebacteria bacterium RBG_13_46_13 TaxID=1802479 RepID=A0A1F7X403_9BACT|nr:MAG: hypothetical protein A2Y68_03770 [Candidatus Woesebacteria bacterium RBG_13_46_13]HJX59226.1 glycosyltransferase family 2 protein [Patescibacteria group bacterium]
MSITAIILCKNEEQNIADCLRSLKFCNEIVVVDDKSSDNTAEIAKSCGARVYERELGEDFSAQRNFGLKKATNEWVLFIDADERVTEKLASEIAKIIKQESDFSGYYIKRQDVIWRKTLKHGEFGSIKLLRLARVDRGKWVRKVHEHWIIQGKVGSLENALMHYPHATLREFISDVNWQSGLHAEANAREGKRSNLFKSVFYPKLKFLNNWITKKGFLDGTEGFVAALIMSFHSFLAWSKLWIKQREK